eukprot:7386857-Prymnesium_polylepis.2
MQHAWQPLPQLLSHPPNICVLRSSVPGLGRCDGHTRISIVRQVISSGQRPAACGLDTSSIRLLELNGILADER